MFPATERTPLLQTKLPAIGTTVFTVMSALASRHGAVNLGQGVPDYDGPAVVLDTGPDSGLARFGVAPGELADGGRPLVHVQVSAFGVDGPRATQPASELTIAALGGPVRLQGSPDRAPVPISVPQKWTRPSFSSYIRPVIFGNQWYSPAKIVKTEPPKSTKWMWATMK